MMTLERALSQFPGHAFVPVMLHCVHLFCKLCNQLQGPKWQASRGDSSAKTSCPEKLQQELAAVTRVPERIDFNGRNNSSLWETRKDGKPFSLCAWSRQDRSWYLVPMLLPAAALCYFMHIYLRWIWKHCICPELPLFGMCVIRSGLE